MNLILYCVCGWAGYGSPFQMTFYWYDPIFKLMVLRSEMASNNGSYRNLLLLICWHLLIIFPESGKLFANKVCIVRPHA